MRSKLLGEVLSASESARPGCGADPGYGAEPAYGADPIDEYRELAMLAHAWEGSVLEPPQPVRPAAGRVEDAEGKEPGLR